ncbi:EamA family transporter [Streptosporangium nondiastaticum]|uniref:EamA family transporter n=2 Tax=Actinomycetes TaxID=1760 RepID=A0A9X7JR57_9ACTN|nr:DMT family transporter [Streptosporangium nondiastaticum]PSJ28221.1 EamA family transporter [Streptosporangium nondiastaticum]
MTSAQRTSIPWAPMAATALLWGSAFTAIQVALPDYSPAAIALLRMAITVVLLLPCLFLGRIGRLRRADALRMAAFGLTGMTAYQVLLCAGEQSVDAGTAAMLIAASPVFTTVLGMAFLGDRPGRRGLAGLAVALTGALTVAVTSGGGSGSLMGALMVLGAAATQATSFALQKPLLKKYSGAECVFYGSLFGMLPLLATAPGAVGQIAAADGHRTLAVLWLGVGCTAMAFWTWSRTLRATTASTASLVLYAVPVAALLLDALFLGNLPSLNAAGGGLLVLAGVAVATVRRASPQPAEPVVERELVGSER